MKRCLVLSLALAGCADRLSRPQPEVPATPVVIAIHATPISDTVVRLMAIAQRQPSVPRIGSFKATIVFDSTLAQFVAAVTTTDATTIARTTGNAVTVAGASATAVPDECLFAVDMRISDIAALETITVRVVDLYGVDFTNLSERLTINQPSLHR